MPWQGFHIWRGRLPHWRALGVTYYVTFRHRRDLEPDEQTLLLRSLLHPDGRKWDLIVVAVGQSKTEIVFSVRESSSGVPIELAEIVEPAKRKSGKKIIKLSGERWPPFYEESFDRIIRDDAEFQELIATIIERQTEEGEDWLYVVPDLTSA